MLNRKETAVGGHLGENKKTQEEMGKQNRLVRRPSKIGSWLGTAEPDQKTTKSKSKHHVDPDWEKAKNEREKITTRGGGKDQPEKKRAGFKTLLRMGGGGIGES